MKLGAVRRAAWMPAAVLVAAVLGGEFILSLQGWRVRAPAARFEQLARGQLASIPSLQYHAERFYTLAPNYRYSGQHAGRFATGAWPFRGRPAQPAPPELLRVVVLGDSTIQGIGVSTSQTLPERLQVELKARGYPPDALQVINLGVGGYTTPQVRLALRAALDRLAPDAVILGCGGWNDQAASLGIDDLDMLRPRAPAAWEAWLPGIAHYLTARSVQPLVLPDDYTEAEIVASWERGEPIYGTKVPAGEVGPQVGAMVTACVDAGVPVVYIVAAHRTETLRDHPRAAQDRDACRAAASDAGATLLDAPQILDASGWSEERLFLDFAHPTPDTSALLAKRLAQVLVELLPPPLPPPVSDLGIVSVEPALASVLGDILVRVELTGWSGPELPVVTIGGAPLLDLHVGDSSGSVEGLLLANGPGELDVLVQTADACAVADGAMTLVLPRLEVLPAGRTATELIVRVHSRPGDRAQVYVSDGARDEPAWWPAGAVWLSGSALPPVAGEWPMGPEGSVDVAIALPAGFADRELFLQARVAPDGSWDDSGVATELVRVSARF